MKKKKLGDIHYIGIAFATVLFWRAVWNILDRMTAPNDSYLLDVITGIFGLALLWYLTRSLKHLD